MRNLSDYKTAIFDCDGVILQSNEIKTLAFREVLENEAIEDIDAFIQYHQEHGGVSRYVKFNYYYKTIKGHKNFQELSEMAIKRYGDLVYNGLLKASLVPGVLNILKLFQMNGTSCFVLSGGDQSELLSVFNERELDQYFKKILGSPLTKIENLNILVKSKCIKKPTVLFGDARSDMNTAQSAELDFCFIYGFSEWSDGIDVVTKNSMPCYKDFVDLLEKEKK